MKKQFVCFLAAGIFSAPLFAQENIGKTSVGLRAGVNFQNINGKDAGGDKLQNDLMTGFHAGLNVEIPVGTGSYLQPGVLYSVKGTKWEAPSGTTSPKTSISYIEIPVNFIYKPDLGTGHMVLGFGPYVGVGISGKVDNNGTKTDVEFLNTSTTSSLNGKEFKRIDGGANFLAGYEFGNKLSFQLNAQLGLMDINPKLPGSAADNDKTNWRNTGWGVSLGYRF